MFKTVQLPTANVQRVAFSNELMGWGGDREGEQHWHSESEISGHPRAQVLLLGPQGRILGARGQDEQLGAFDNMSSSAPVTHKQPTRQTSWSSKGK